MKNNQLSVFVNLLQRIEGQIASIADLGNSDYIIVGITTVDDDEVSIAVTRDMFRTSGVKFGDEIVVKLHQEETRPCQYCSAKEYPVAVSVTRKSGTARQLASLTLCC